MNGSQQVAEDTLEYCQDNNVRDRNRIRSLVKDHLSDYFWKKTQRRPMVLPMILEIG